MRGLVSVLLAAGLTASSGVVSAGNVALPVPPATSTPVAPGDGLHRIPPRPAAATAGSEFARRITGLSGRAREGAILAEVLQGNIPDFLRQLRPVELTVRVRDRQLAATVWTMPDYLAVGSDDDFVRFPVDFYAAVVVAERFGMTLPTGKIVDAVHRQAILRLKPQPMPPGPRMSSTPYYVEHNRRIEAQRGGHPLGQLVAGHKKDLVLTNRLARQPPRVAIYGWHRRNGEPIQPLSTVHGARYADYSHGLRLVSRRVRVNGAWRDLFDALSDRELSRLLTREAPMRASRLLNVPASVRAERDQSPSVKR